MKSNSKLFLPLALIILSFLIFRTWRGYGITQKMMHLKISDMGMNSDLFELVTVLENEIKKRNLYELQLTSDPLKLTKILKGSKKKLKANFDSGENRGALRLSCTVVSAKKSIAILKYKGKSYNVSVGDRINGRVVSSIDKKKVVLNFKGADEVLFNKPAPKGELHRREELLKHTNL